MLDAGTKVVVHNEPVDDKLVGILGGFFRWSGMVSDPNECIAITELIAKRQLDPFAREIILTTHEIN
ncbi:MAG: hypothetical protein RLY45_446, partial [Actinomycetota bacterium]